MYLIHQLDCSPGLEEEFWGLKYFNDCIAKPIVVIGFRKILAPLKKSHLYSYFVCSTNRPLGRYYSNLKFT